MTFRGKRPRGTYYGKRGGPHIALLDVPKPPPPLGQMIRSVSKSVLGVEASDFADTAAIRNCKLVASYNWLDEKESTILIPGKPPRWTPLDEPVKLKEDNGQYFRDRNAARYPKHPMEPAVIASLAAEPLLPSQVDVVACGSTIGNLLRFVRGQDKPFRMSVEKVHDTVFFIRREGSPTETIPNVRGYGHTFPEAYTTWEQDVKGSASHQRMIRYTFGGLGFLLRFEADGYLADSQSLTAAPKNEDDDRDLSIGQLADMLSKKKVSSEVPSASTKVRVVSGGDTVKQDVIFDLKTRASWKKNQDILSEELPRLWVAQIDKFILAYHINGLFEDIETHDVKTAVSKWERDHIDDLSHLAALIHRIIALVSTRPGGRLELCHSLIGTLEFHEQLPDVSDALSLEVKTLWKEGVSGGSSDDRGSPDGSDNTQLSPVYHSEGGSDPEDSGSFHWDEGSEPDFTACSADSCGYCGKCTY